MTELCDFVGDVPHACREDDEVAVEVAKMGIAFVLVRRTE